MIVMTFQNEHTWDVSPDIGFLTFATPGDARKAEELFNRIQAEAKAFVKDAARYRYLRDTPPWKSKLSVVIARDVGDDIAMLTQEGLDGMIDQALSS